MMHRLQLAGVLWPEKSDSRALANLRSTLWRTAEEIGDVIVTDEQEVALVQSVQIDIRELERRCLVEVKPGCSLSDLLAFIHLASTELLPGWYDDWVMFERERIRQVSLYGLEALAAALQADGRLADAVIVGAAVVASDPVRESAHRLVIAAHLEMGNVAEARRQFELCRGYLRLNLGLQPSPTMLALFDGHGDVPAEPPRVRPLWQRH